MEKRFPSPSIEIFRVHRWDGLFKNILRDRPKSGRGPLLTIGRGQLTTVPAGFLNSLTCQPRQVSVGSSPCSRDHKSMLSEWQTAQFWAEHARFSRSVHVRNKIFILTIRVFLYSTFSQRFPGNNSQNALTSRTV